MSFKTSIFSIFCMISAIFCLNSCETSTFEEEDYDGTWTFSWQKCGLNHTAFSGAMSFTFSDSLGNTGFITQTTEEETDTLLFQFEFIGTETLIIDSITGDSLDGLWEGTHQISDEGANSFVLERENKNCDNEQFKLKK